MSDNPYISPPILVDDFAIEPTSANLRSYHPVGRLLYLNLVLATIETSIWTGLLSISVLSLPLSRQVNFWAYIFFFSLSVAWKATYVFLTYRCLANSQALTQKRGPANPFFVVLSYGIPILNLALPYYAIKHSYRICGLREGWLLALWWLSHLVAYGLPLVVVGIFASPLKNALEKYRSSAELALSLALIAIAIMLAVYSHLVLSRLAARQAQLAHHLPTSSSPPTALNDPPPMRFSTWGGD